MDESVTLCDKTTGTPAALNDYPIIGVLSQEVAYKLELIYPGRYKSFIAASYVKFLEGGGARVVPIWIGRPRSYYEEVMKKINGILFPGGSTWFHVSDGYADAGMHIYSIAKEMNDNGEYFPLWGTCLGFELLSYVDADRNEHRKEFKFHNASVPVKLEDEYKQSRLLQNASSEIIQYLETKPVTTYFHRYFITKECLKKAGVEQNWRIISSNTWDGSEFISMFEHKKYPFYGVQFHPEKNLYEWIQEKNIDHSEPSIAVAQYFAQFFVQECRKSGHKFKCVEEERECLIYNFPITYTGLKDAIYQQCYLFQKDTDYPAVEWRKLLAVALAMHVILFFKKLVKSPV